MSEQGWWPQDAQSPSSAPTDSLHPLHSVLLQISNQEPQDRKFAVHSLTWLTHAKKDLSPTVLVQSYTIRQTEDASSCDFNRPEEDIVSVCKGLVTIVQVGKKTKIVKFAWEPTLSQLQDYELVDCKPHLTIISTCLTYLQSNEFAKYMPSCEEIVRRPRDYDLLVHYAVYCWMKHLPEATEDELAEAEPLVTQFLECDEKVTSWYQVWANAKDGSITGLHATAAFALVTVAKRLLEKRRNVNATTTLGQTPLHWAVLHERPSMVKLLLENSAQRDIQDEDKNTALHLAARFRGKGGPGPCMELLCEPMGQDSQGAAEMAVISNCINIRNGSGLTPFDLALRSMEKRYDPVSPYGDVYGDEAATKQTWYGIAKLLARLHPVKSIDNDGPYLSPMRRVMMLTSSDEVRTRLVEVLLQGGTDVSRPTNDGDLWHPLIEAAAYMGEEMTENLLMKGSPVDVKDGKGRTPLRCAIASDKLNLVSTLLGHGADANYRYEKDITPLMEACEGKTWLIAMYLLDSGADPNARKQDGSTALHCAVEGRWTRPISILFQHKADLSIRNNDGMTALDIAVKNGYKKAVRELLIDKDQIRKVDRDTIHSAVRLASRKGDEMMIHQLSDGGRPADKPMNYSKLLLQCEELALKEPLFDYKQLGLSKVLEYSDLLDVYQPPDAHELVNRYGQSGVNVLRRFRQQLGCQKLEAVDALLAVVQQLRQYPQRPSFSITDEQRASSDAFEKTFREVMGMQDEMGYTVLHLALQSPVDRFATILTLLNYYAEVDVKDNEGRTPLELAREMGRRPETVLLGLWSQMLATMAILRPESGDIGVS